jgi:hypothetical protein
VSRTGAFLEEGKAKRCGAYVHLDHLARENQTDPRDAFEPHGEIGFGCGEDAVLLISVFFALVFVFAFVLVLVLVLPGLLRSRRTLRSTSPSSLDLDLGVLRADFSVFVFVIFIFLVLVLILVLAGLFRSTRTLRITSPSSFVLDLGVPRALFSVFFALFLALANLLRSKCTLRIPSPLSFNRLPEFPPLHDNPPLLPRPLLALA